MTTARMILVATDLSAPARLRRSGRAVVAIQR